MRILFTHSNKIASKLIRKLLQEPVSHCALELDGHVIHSNFLGIQIETLSHFDNQCEIWGEVQLPDDHKKMFELMCMGWGKKYDFGALLYIALRTIFPILPKKNLWQSTGMFLCTEWVDSYFGKPDPMTTPYQIYRRFGGTKQEETA